MLPAAGIDGSSMTTSKKKALFGTVLVFGVCSLAVVLARPQWIGLGTERALRKRAAGYWDARLANDMKAMSPYVHPLQKSIQENTILVTESYEITDVKVEGDEAVVGIKAKYRLKEPLMAKVEREVTHDDKWVRYKGEWYHAPHPVGLGEVLQQGLGKWKPPTEAPPPRSNPGGVSKAK
jgi:hypothetical protein